MDLFLTCTRLILSDSLVALIIIATFNFNYMDITVDIAHFLARIYTLNTHLYKVEIFYQIYIVLIIELLRLKITDSLVPFTHHSPFEQYRTYLSPSSYTSFLLLIFQML